MRTLKMGSKKDAFYFRHDMNARNDIALSALRVDAAKLWAGAEPADEDSIRNVAMYGVYLMVIEILREQGLNRMKYNQVTIKYIAREANLPAALIDIFLKEALTDEIGLFKLDEDGCFYSERLCCDMDEINRLRDRYSSAGKEGMRIRYGTDIKVKPENSPDAEPQAPRPVATPRKKVFDHGFYELWDEYCRKIGGSKSERKIELDFVEKNFKDSQPIAVSRLFKAVTSNKCGDLMDELRAAANK